MAKKKTTRKRAKKSTKRRVTKKKTTKKPRSKKIKDHIVKRQGHTQRYDPKKVYASVFAASLNCHYNERKSERIATQVLKAVNAWNKTRASVSSDAIRKQILKHIKDEHVALMYKHHLDIC